jgi:hypothetical protein
MSIAGMPRLTKAASTASERTPKCLLTSARQRMVRIAASVCASV